MNKTLENKYNKLIEYIKSFGSAAVAFSGGVDSTLLLYAAKQALGSNVLAVTASIKSFPLREFNEATDYCSKLGVRQVVSRLDELSIEGFSQNPPNRCYICKKEIFTNIISIANSNGITAVMEGSNLDDDGDYRPGHRAIAELNVLSPLRYAGLTKQEIRDLSQEFGLPTWDKPSYACLASRFPYGEEITAEKLTMVDKGEQLLMDLGFRQMRVRIHGKMARIELPPEDFAKFMNDSIRLQVLNEFKSYGFNYVSLDIQGYRTGSMNEVIKKSI